MTTSPLLRFSRRLEETDLLDEARRRLPFQRIFTARPEVRDLLQGRRAGHAIHPVLVTVPLGALTGALLLDALAERSAADKLMFLALVAAVPSAVTGWAEWADADDKSQRVGVVHAGVNALGILLVASSCLARRRHQRVRGVTLASLAGVVWGLGGYLGGHISLVRKYASHADGEVGGAGHGSYRA